MIDTKNVAQADDALRVELQRTSMTRHPCLFCGGFTEKTYVQATVFAGAKRTGWVACDRCLSKSPAEVRQAVRDQATRKMAFANELLELANALLPLPTRAEWEAANDEADAEYMAQDAQARKRIDPVEADSDDQPF